MRVSVDKSRQHNASASVNDLRAARFSFDLIARPNAVDLVIADQDPAIANDSELRHLCANAWALRTRERD